MNEISYERLIEVLKYNPNTGDFSWLLPRYKGCTAGTIVDGYICITIDNIRISAQRLAVLYMKKHMPKGIVDHKNQIKTDNKWSNLKDDTNSSNMRNSCNPSNNTSGIKGVVYDKTRNKWCPNISVNGKQRKLGRFDCIIEAVAHRFAAEQCLHWQSIESLSPAYKYLKGEKYVS